MKKSIRKLIDTAIEEVWASTLDFSATASNPEYQTEEKQNNIKHAYKLAIRSVIYSLVQSIMNEISNTISNSFPRSYEKD